MIVVSRIEIQLAAHLRHRLNNLCNVAARLFNRDNVLVLRERGVSVWFNVDPRAGGDVIENHRLCARIGNGVVHLDQALLGRLIVVRRHHQNSIRPVLTGGLGQLKGIGRLIAAGLRR